MSVVYQSEVGLVLDHRQWIVKTYHLNDVIARVPSRAEDHSMFPFQDITKEDPHEISIPEPSRLPSTSFSPADMIPLATRYSTNPINALIFKSDRQEQSVKLISSVSDKNFPNLATNSPRKTGTLSRTTCPAAPAGVGLMSRDVFRITAKSLSECSPDTGGNSEEVQPCTASTPIRDKRSLPGPGTAPLLHLFDLRTPFLMVSERQHVQTSILR